MENALMVLPYPPTESIGGSAIQSAAPLKMIYQLPEYLYLDIPDIRVGWWNPAIEGWSEEQIENINLDKETRQLAYVSIRMAPHALLLTRTTDYPYEQWFLRSTAYNRATLDLKTKRLQFRFIIEPNAVTLVDRQNLPELASLCGVKMSIGVLLQEMARCGILLLPEDRDGEAAGIDVKEEAVEERAILDVSLSIRAFAFSLSTWNRQLGRDRLAVRARENLDYDEEFAEDEEQDWKGLVWYENRMTVARLRESAERADVRPLEGHETHSLLHLALQANADFSEEATSRCTEVTVHVGYSETVRGTLRLLRLLSFS